MTKELAIIETHSVRPNWEALYLRPLKRHFGHVAVVGVSDHKAGSSKELRYILFCSQKPLDNYITKRARDIACKPTPYTIDTQKSTVRHIDAFLSAIDANKGISLEDAAKLSAKRWPNLSAAEVGTAVKQKGLVAAQEYWAAYLRGFLEYRAEGRLTEKNFYYQTLFDMVAKDLYDGAFKAVFDNPAAAVPRLARRFSMLESGIASDPILVFSPVLEPGAVPTNPYLLHFNPIDTPVRPLALDGHHRLFAAYVQGDKELPCLPVWTDQLPYIASMIAKQPELEAQIWANVYPLNQKLCELTPEMA
jgi:hypothetical protein